MPHLCSSLLQFSRDGRTLLAGDRDAVSIVDLRGGATRTLTAEAVLATLGFADQLWIAAGRTPVLTRYALD
nr:hypothetical protein [Deltaproteobacteria bacterium]